MIFGFLLSSLLLMAPHHQLPIGWHTEGHSFKLNEQWGPHPQEPSVLDTTGRYLYTSDLPCHQWDFKTGLIREFTVVTKVPWGQQEKPGWSLEIQLLWGHTPPNATLFDFARGNLLAAKRLTQIKGSMAMAYAGFVARIGGPVFRANAKTGYLPIVHAGFDLLLGSKESLVNNGFRVVRGKYSTSSDEIMVAHDHQLLRAKLPQGLANCFSLPGGISWSSKQAFIISGFGWQKNFGYFINYGKHKPSIRAVPLPPISVTPICILANGSICGQQIDQRKNDFLSVAIYSIHSRKWQVFPGLMIYGVSANGRAIVYGWWGEDHIHLARISGSW